MDYPSCYEIEGHPIAPGLNIVADVYQVLIARGALHEELNHDSGCYEQKDEDDIAEKGSEDNFGKAVCERRLARDTAPAMRKGLTGQARTCE